ncbi:MAG: hypothetical protein V4633_04615 [Pseudomonadota bacterium]
MLEHGLCDGNDAFFVIETTIANEHKAVDTIICSANSPPDMPSNQKASLYFGACLSGGFNLNPPNISPIDLEKVRELAELPSECFPSEWRPGAGQ